MASVQSAGGLECLRVQEAHQGLVRSLKVSPDGRMLASCGDDGVIALWDMRGDQALRRLRRDRPYERLNITKVRGLTQAQLASFRALGAVEDEAEQERPGVSGRREAMSSEPRAGTVEKQTGRLESFSDGVFAVAITLLVFNLQVPHLPGGAISVSALGIALLKQWPSYLTFMTSFATILIMWASHHGIFKLVYKADTPFLFANGLLLLLVTVVPFPTSLVAQYLNTPAAALACAVYAGIFVVINVAYNLLWWAAMYQRRLLHPAVTPRQVKKLTRHILLGLPVYLLASLLAFWNPSVSLGLCSCLWIFWAFTFYERSPSPRRLTTGQDVETAPASDA